MLMARFIVPFPAAFKGDMHMLPAARKEIRMHFEVRGVP